MKRNVKIALASGTLEMQTDDRGKLDVRAAASAADKAYSVKQYGDVKFADAKNKKYPIDTEAHIRAAWNYINKKNNADQYSEADLKTVKDNIIAAWKKVIDKAGPPSAGSK